MLPLARFVAAGACMFALAATAGAQTLVTLTPDRDAGLYDSATGTIANGAGTAMFSGTTGQPAVRRALLRFDVAAALPANAIVLAAELSLSVVASSNAQPMDYDAHRITQAWSEGPTVAPGGQGAGGTAQTGDVTWLHTNYPNAFWTTPGGDFAPAPSFSGTMPPIGAYATGYDAGLLTDVRAFQQSPASNHGWILIGDELNPSTSTKIATRESGTPPELRLWYVVPGDTGSWGSGTTIGAATMQLTTSGVPAAGATLPLDYTGAPASQVGATFFSIDLVPGGITLAPDRTALLDLGKPIVAGGLFTTDVSGVANSSVVVPGGGLGFVLSAQGAVLDGSALGFAVSNAVLIAPL